MMALPSFHPAPCGRNCAPRYVDEGLLRFACYVAVSYKVYGMDFQYLDTNYLFGLVEKVRPDMV